MDKPIQTASLSEQVYQVLKQQIIERKVKPNDKLDINALAEELGVSRTPILDALTRLEVDRLVVSKNRVGTYVAPLDRAMYEEIFDARLMVENWAIQQASEHLTEQRVEALHDLLRRSAQLLVGVDAETFDYRSFIKYDQNFHLALIEVCSNSRVSEFYRSLNIHIQIARVYALRPLNRSIEGQGEHEAILQHLANHDVKNALKAQQYHLERSRENVLRSLERYQQL